MITHTQQRITERKIDVNDYELRKLASRFAMDTAIVLSRGIHKGMDDGDYMTRNESNGDMVVLIVRNRRPVTIMYRRSSQTNTAEQLRVSQIVEL